MESPEEACLRVQSFESETLAHWGILYRAAYGLLGCRAEAEDEVQETYLQAWKSFDGFEPGTNCRAWLFAILFNKVRQHRRKWTLRFLLTNDADLFEKQAEANDFAVSGDLTDPDILEALRELPRQYAEAILLADVQDLDYKEISTAIGRPIGTVMSRISRGREMLRRSLAEAARQRGILRKPAAAVCEA